jgi:lipoprotein-releasing system permease protein
VSLSLEIALRYLRRRSSRLVSRVSLLAIGGVALGVAALVIAMGLLTGYREEIQDKLIGANAEVVEFPLTSGGIERPDELARRLAAYPRVAATAAVIYAQGVASSEALPEGKNVVLKGVDPAGEARVTTIPRDLRDAEKHFGAGDSGGPGCAIGRDLARSLSLRPGDTLSIAVPDASRRGVRFQVRRRAFRVSRIFQTNFYEYDSGWIFLDREAARFLLGLPAPANVLEIRLDTIENTPEATARIRQLIGDRFTATDWRSLNGNLFSALTLQKITLFLVIGLIVAVSTFNIVATLVMSVQEKRRDIGAMSALGAPPALFTSIFLRLGALLGGAGTLLGLAFGSLVCLVLTRGRLVSFPPEVAEIYFVSFVPFLVRAWDLAAITVFSLAVIAAASYFPARRASKIDVAEALRYE